MMAENQPLVSIIVPVYNVAPFLDDCVQSLLAQTYEAVEILLADDGSTDESGTLCDAYASDPRVTVLHLPNGGAGKARNAAIAVSHGDYITFADSDDIAAPTMVETLLTALLAHPEAGMCSAAYDVIAQDGSLLEERTRTETAPLRVSGVFSAGEMYEKLCAPDGEHFIGLWTKLFRRSVVTGYPMPEKEHEDEYVIPFWFRDAGKTVLIPDTVYHYRMRTNSVLHATKKRIAERIATVGAHLERTALFTAEGYPSLAADSFQYAFIALCLIRALYDDGEPEAERLIAENLAAMDTVYRQCGQHFPGYIRLMFPLFCRFPKAIGRGVLRTVQRQNMGFDRRILGLDD